MNVHVRSWPSNVAYFYPLMIKQQNLGTKATICSTTGPSYGVTWTWWSPLCTHRKLFSEGEKEEKLLTNTHFLNCCFSADPSASDSLTTSFAAFSNFRLSRMDKKSSAPSQVSLFLTLLYPNITHFLSRGVKSRSLEEVSRKERVMLLEGPCLHEGRGRRLASTSHGGKKH